MNLKNKQWLLLLFMLMIILFAGCRTPAGRSMGQVVDDSTITSEVKTKLFQDKMLSGIAISVDTFQGNVTLTGAVNSDQMKDRAENIAKSVTGVRGVNNLLEIKSDR